MQISANIYFIIFFPFPTTSLSQKGKINFNYIIFALSRLSWLTIFFLYFFFFFIKQLASSSFLISNLIYTRLNDVYAERETLACNSFKIEFDKVKLEDKCLRIVQAKHAKILENFKNLACTIFFSVPLSHRAEHSLKRLGFSFSYNTKFLQWCLLKTEVISCYYNLIPHHHPSSGTIPVRVECFIYRNTSFYPRLQSNTKLFE